MHLGQDLVLSIWLNSTDMKIQSWGFMSRSTVRVYWDWSLALLLVDSLIYVYNTERACSSIMTQKLVPLLFVLGILIDSSHNGGQT